MIRPLCPVCGKTPMAEGHMIKGFVACGNLDCPIQCAVFTEAGWKAISELKKPDYAGMPDEEDDFLK